MRHRVHFQRHKKTRCVNWELPIYVCKMCKTGELRVFYEPPPHGESNDGGNLALPSSFLGVHMSPRREKPRRLCQPVANEENMKNTENKTAN